MKLQHLSIVFIIIMLPIILVISSYIETQIDTINLQTKYNLRLQTATYDSIKAFQLNTLNNKYSSLSDSKIRDIEAAVSTFYNSLGVELGSSGYDEESLQQFIPAIVYTMYDGYYIYGKYKNEITGEYQYGLRPYIYYSCRYKSGTDDFVVNYALDNYISVTGKIDGEYVSKSGPIIDPSKVTNIIKDSNGNVISVTYDAIVVEKEILKEQLIVDNVRDEYEYTNYLGQKIYKEGSKYFRVVNNSKEYINESSDMFKFLVQMTQNGHLYCNNGAEYYAKAKEFSEWAMDKIGNITQNNAVDENGQKITFDINTQNEKIFNFSDTNDPLLDSSTFNENRISVIRRVIQSTLNTAISNFSSNANYEFVMPKFTEEDWEKLVNNVTIATFMQGIPIGTKYYNNYCIITNNFNEEVVNKDSIYIITNDGEVHKAGSKDVVDNKKVVTEAYKNTDFKIQTVVISAGNERYYYPHSNSKCYTCMVNAAITYDINDIIQGTVKSYDKETDTYINTSKDISGLRKIYLTALGREKYNILPY